MDVAKAARTQCQHAQFHPGRTEWNGLPTNEGHGTQSKAQIPGIFPYHFPFCTNSITHGCHVRKSSDLPLAPDLGSWVSSRVPWLWRLFSGKPLQPGWTTWPPGILSPSVTRETRMCHFRASPQSRWARTPHNNLSSTSGKGDQKRRDIFIRSKNIRVRRNDIHHLANLTSCKMK